MQSRTVHCDIVASMICKSCIPLKLYKLVGSAMQLRNTKLATQLVRPLCRKEAQKLAGAQKRAVKASGRSLSKDVLASFGPINDQEAFVKDNFGNND